MASAMKNVKPQIASQQITTNVNALYEATIEKYLSIGYKYNGTPNDNAATLKYTCKGGVTAVVIAFECLVMFFSIPIDFMLDSDMGKVSSPLTDPVVVILFITTLLTHIYNNKVDIRITKTNKVQTIGFTEKKMNAAVKRKNIIRIVVTILCAGLVVLWITAL